MLSLMALWAARLPAQTDFYNTDAGRPVTVEDAYPLERRGFELQFAPLRLERSPGGAYMWGLEPELAYGILPRTQVEVALPLAFMDAGNGRSASGLAGIDLSMLYTLNVETAIPALAVAAEVLLPAGGLGPKRVYPSLKGILTKSLSRTRIHLNGRYTAGNAPLMADGPPALEVSRWMGGVALDRTFPLRSLLVTAELLAEQPLSTTEDVEWKTGAGFRYQLHPRWAIDAGAGYRLTGHARPWSLTFGSAFALGMPWHAGR